MKIVNKAKKVFDRLFDLAYWWPSRHSPSRIRNGEAGVPGELLSYLSEEDRQDLSKLTSDDLSADKVSKEQAQLAADQSNYLSPSYYEQSVKEVKQQFDAQIIRHPLRRKRYGE